MGFNKFMLAQIIFKELQPNKYNVLKRHSETHAVAFVPVI